MDAASQPALIALMLLAALLWNGLVLAATTRARSEDPELFEALGEPALFPGVVRFFSFLYAPSFVRTKSPKIARQRTALKVLFPVVLALLVLCVRAA